MSDTTQTPEADAIPTPAAPTPAAAGDIISALLAFAGKQATGPLEQQAIQEAQQILQQHQGELASALGQSGPLTVKGVVDKVFAFVEGKARRPFVKMVLGGLNLLVDDVALPALQIYLTSMGIPLPLS